MKYLAYVSFTRNGKTILTDFTITADSIVDMKNIAMSRMARANGTNRKIDEFHVIDEAFRRHEAEMVEH